MSRLETTKWLVTGGAGYIGAHVVRALLLGGAQVVVIDDLSTGQNRRLPASVPLVVANAAKSDLVHEVLNDFAIDGVVHLAARKQARESMSSPADYWTTNIGTTLALVQALPGTRVQALVLSSSCSIFGDGQSVRANAPVSPLSPYAWTKHVAEKMLVQTSGELGFSLAILRYFNVIGNDNFPGAYDTAAQSLVPSVFRMIRQGEAPLIYGKDFETPDGTCLRDYLDVRDLSQAHSLAAYQTLNSSNGLALEVNLGTGQPVSVLEIVNAAASIAGLDLEPIFVPRKPGDPAAIWADPSEAQLQLSWEASVGLKESLLSHWSLYSRE